MSDSALKLQDKTILLVGPFNGITQAILRTMTELGSDIGFVSPQPGYAAKYIDGLNEAREAHPQFGRAVLVHVPMGSEPQIQEALGKVVQNVGRMDAMIDATPLQWTSRTDPHAASQMCATVAEKLVPFFQAKQKGRIVYLVEDACLDKMSTEGVGSACREILVTMVETLAQKYRAQNVTINALSIGVTDDLLTRLFPGIPSLKKAFEELTRNFPGTKLVDFNDVGLGCAYLASVLSASVTGQTLRLTHGSHL